VGQGKGVSRTWRCGGNQYPEPPFALEIGRELSRLHFSRPGPRFHRPDGFFGWIAGFLAGWPVFSLPGRLSFFPDGHLGVCGAQLSSRASIFLPEEPSSRKNSPSFYPGPPSSFRSAYLSSRGSSWRSGPPSSLVRLGMVERPAGI